MPPGVGGGPLATSPVALASAVKEPSKTTCTPSAPGHCGAPRPVAMTWPSARGLVAISSSRHASQFPQRMCRDSAVARSGGAEAGAGSPRGPVAGHALASAPPHSVSKWSPTRTPPCAAKYRGPWPGAAERSGLTAARTRPTAPSPSGKCCKRTHTHKTRESSDVLHLVRSCRRGSAMGRRPQRHPALPTAHDMQSSVARRLGQARRQIPHRSMQRDPGRGSPHKQRSDDDPPCQHRDALGASSHALTGTCAAQLESSCEACGELHSTRTRRTVGVGGRLSVRVLAHAFLT